jgi:hypothetical protein
MPRLAGPVRLSAVGHAMRRKTWDPQKRYQTSLRMSKRCHERLCALARWLGCSRAAVVEMAIRTLYRQRLANRRPE